MSVLLLVLLLLLIAINGFFVAAEFALVRSRRGKIEQLARRRRMPGAEAVVEQLDKIDESLSACQIGITIASIGIGFLGEPALAELIEPLFGSLSHGVAAGALAGDRLHPRHRAAHQRRRAGAEDAGDRQRREHALLPGLAAAELVPRPHCTR